MTSPRSITTTRSQVFSMNGRLCSTTITARPSGCKPAAAPPTPPAEHRIAASHRLVQDDEAGLSGRDAREFEQPFLAAAEPHRTLVLQIRQLEALKDGPDRTQ